MNKTEGLFAIVQYFKNGSHQISGPCSYQEAIDLKLWLDTGLEFSMTKVVELKFLD